MGVGSCCGKVHFRDYRHSGLRRAKAEGTVLRKMGGDTQKRRGVSA